MKSFLSVLLTLTLFCGAPRSAEANNSVTVRFFSDNRIVMTANASLARLPARFEVEGTGYSGYYFKLKQTCSAREALWKIAPSLCTAMDELGQEVNVEPKNATVTFDKNGFKYFEAEPGRKIDFEKTTDALICGLSGRYCDVNIVFCDVEADIQTDDLKNATRLVSSFSTAVSGSENRRHNVGLAAKKLNGCTVFPREEFSFNKVVGRRTEENGFRTATVISDGKYVDGTGGGVCQVSTTLYNAVLMAGLTVKRVAAHSLAPSYVTVGFDAMVSDGSDFVFKNDFDFSVYISAGYDGRNVKVSVYGAKSEWDKIERKSRVVEELPFETVYERNPAAPVGETVVFEGKNGLKVESYLVYRKGDFVKTVRIRVCTYKPQNRKISVGLSESDEEGG